MSDFEVNSFVKLETNTSMTQNILMNGVKIEKIADTWNDRNKFQTSLESKKNQVALKELYHLATRENSNDFGLNPITLGGPGVIVILDLYSVRLEIDADTKLQEDYKIFAFAEVKENPPRHYFKLEFNNDLSETKIVDQIKTIVLPGSILIMENNIYNYITKNMNIMFASMVSHEMLERHNTNSQFLSDNLAAIWESIYDSCDETCDFYDIENILFGLLLLKQNAQREYCINNMFY